NLFPDPWPGGWWRLSDIIDYEMEFARSLFGSVSRDRELYLANAIEAAERSIQAGLDSSPKAWLLPPDNENRRAVKRLIGILLLGGVEVKVAIEDFEADARSYPKGTIVVSRNQPYGSHVKDLFEVQRYPKGKAPYDVAGWTLPMLFGLRRVEVVTDFDVALKDVTQTPERLTELG
ncbi:MAG: peptidase M14, partial [Planctomycetes bacterium]|nr:peptidase M14 [Planctomycetota bacterium]